jgi:hypothetical protein
MSNGLHTLMFLTITNKVYNITRLRLEFLLHVPFFFFPRIINLYVENWLDFFLKKEDLLPVPWCISLIYQHSSSVKSSLTFSFNKLYVMNSLRAIIAIIFLFRWNSNYLLRSSNIIAIIFWRSNNIAILICQCLKIQKTIPKTINCTTVLKYF